MVVVVEGRKSGDGWESGGWRRKVVIMERDVTVEEREKHGWWDKKVVMGKKKE